MGEFLLVEKENDTESALQFIGLIMSLLHVRGVSLLYVFIVRLIMSFCRDRSGWMFPNMPLNNDVKIEASYASHSAGVKSLQVKCNNYGACRITCCKKTAF